MLIGNQHRYTPLTPHHRRYTPRPRTITYSLLLIFLIPLALLTLSLITYLTTSVSRPCLPFSLHRISSTGHRLLSCSAISSNSASEILGSESFGEMTGDEGAGIGTGGLAGGPSNGGASGSDGLSAGPSRLAGFLQSQKESFMGDLGKRNLKGWTIAMGNEAGGASPPIASTSLLATHRI